jgi:hypothetical protein
MSKAEKPNNTSRLSRRTALSGIAGIAAAGTAVLPGAARLLSGEHPDAAAGHDAELIALGAELDALQPLIIEAERAANVAHDAFMAEARRRLPEGLNDDGFMPLYEEIADKETIDRADALQDRGFAIFERMKALPVHTMQGAAALARATVISGYLHYCTDPHEDDLDWDEKIIRNLIERVCVSGGTAVPVTSTRPPADAKLLAMAPAFEALYERWIDYTVACEMDLQEFDAEVERRTGVSSANRPYPHKDDHPFWIVWKQISDERDRDDPPDDENGEAPRTFMDDLHDMAHEILWNYRPTTRAGLRLQVLAVTSSWCEAWESLEDDTGPAEFIASVASFCDVTFPPYLSLKGQLPGEDEDDEEPVIVDHPAADPVKRFEDFYDGVLPAERRSFDRTVQAIVKAVKARRAA